MFSFRRVFPATLADQRGMRTRVLGILNPKQVLFLVAHVNRTEILLLDVDGKSRTVLEFNRYMDIVSADLSDDQELLAYTERIPNGGIKFKFRSVIFHIHSFGTLRDFENNSPITTFFLSCKKKYQLIHVIGRKIALFQVDIINKHLKIQSLRFSGNGENCRSFFINSHLMCGLTQSSALLFTFKNEFYSTIKSYKSEDGTILPDDLAILPSTPQNWPFFRFSSGNMIVIKVLNDFAIIEQIYRGQDNPLYFSIKYCDKKYSKIIKVPNVDPSVPINFFHQDPLCFVFAANLFVIMIDFAIYPPSIFFLPKSLCSGSISYLTTTSSNFTIDFESGELYHTEISLQNIPHSLNFDDKTIMKIFATFMSRIPSLISISNVLRLIPDNSLILLCFFQKLFEIGMSTDITKRSFIKHFGNGVDKLAGIERLISKEVKYQIEEMQQEFPSMGMITRTDFFIYLLKYYHLMGSNNDVEYAMKQLKAQNRLVLAIRAGIDEWIQKYSPSSSQQLSISLSILNEAKKASSPEIPCLEFECEALSNEICPNTIKMHLRCAHIVGVGHIIHNRDTEELDYWAKRMPDEYRQSLVNRLSLEYMMLSKRNESINMKSDLSSSDVSNYTDISNYADV